MKATLAPWLLLCFFTLVYSRIIDRRDLDAPFLACYDYIVCGGALCADLHISRISKRTFLLTRVQVVEFLA
jgi:hypothetical protein